MTMLTTLINLAVAAMLIELAMSANYTVGGSNGGWDTSTNLQTWASSQSFLVGDNLIFQYTANHDVLEVTKADYDSCQASNPIQPYSGGNTIIPLSTPGNRYFICGTIGHCGQGMKIEIDTLAISAPPPASESPSTPPASSPATPPTSSPPPKTSPTPSPAQSPKSASPMSPPSPSNSPSSNPTSPPDVPSTGSPTTSPPPNGSLEPPTPPPSSAYKVSFQSSLAMGFAPMMLLAL